MALSPWPANAAEAALGWLALASALAFAACGLDKARAARGRRRVPERVLLGLAALGGSPGLLLGMAVFRHKTRKGRFRAAALLVLGVQALLAWALLRV